MMKFCAALFALVPSIALASSGGEHSSGGIPEAVTFQFINFAIYAALLFFLLKKPIKEFFGGREQSYKQALAKAQAARVEAEAKRKEMQERLTQLESSSAEAIAKARAEAESLKQKIVADAGQLSELLKEEAKKTAQIEIDRARNELREELLSQSVALSTKLLQDKMVAKDQERLQTEFVDKIQVVGQ